MRSQTRSPILWDRGINLDVIFIWKSSSPVIGSMEKDPHYPREQNLISQLVKHSVVDVLLIHLGWTTRLQLDSAVQLSEKIMSSPA